MEKKTNGMSIAAIIFAFIFPLVGLILGIIAKKKDPDDKLAKAAFIISLVFIIIGVVSTIGCVACGGAVLVPSMSEYIEKSREASGYIAFLGL